MHTAQQISDSDITERNADFRRPARCNCGLFRAGRTDGALPCGHRWIAGARHDDGNSCGQFLGRSGYTVVGYDEDINFETE